MYWRPSASGVSTASPSYSCYNTATANKRLISPIRKGTPSRVGSTAAAHTTSFRQKEDPRHSTSNRLFSGGQDSGILTNSEPSCQLSPSLPVYSWEETDETEAPMMTPARLRGSKTEARGSGGDALLTTRSMERLPRSAFELDIPDMRTTREDRERSRRELHQLNEKLADQVEGMRYLGAHNKQLTNELDSLKGRWIAESENIKAIYEEEMRQLRQLLDDAEREKADCAAKHLSAQQTTRNQGEQLERMAEDNNRMKRQLQALLDDAGRSESEFAALQRRLEDVEADLGRERSSAQRLQQDNDTLCQHLDEETAGRLAGQAEMQSLREELAFVRRAHADETRELQRTMDDLLKKTSKGPDREIWQHELAHAIHEIQARYDVQLEKLNEDMEDMYNARLRELEKMNPDQKAEISALRSDNARLKQTSDSLRDQVAQLQSKNAYLEASAQDNAEEVGDLRRRLEAELEHGAREREEAEAAQARAHVEAAALMDVKLNLEAEIEAYRCLLDTLEGYGGASQQRPSIASQSRGGVIGGGGTARESVLSRPRHSSMSPQRRSEVLRSIAPITDIAPRYSTPQALDQNQHSKQRRSSAKSVKKSSKNIFTSSAPRDSTPAAHRFPERSDPTGSSIRSRTVEFDGEDHRTSDQRRESHLPQSQRSGELTARTQFDKSYKGSIAIDECSPDGRYIVVVNNGNTTENLNGWRIVRNIDHGKQIIRFTFGDTPMPPKSSRKIWAQGQRGSETALHDIESPYSTWGVGSYIYTTLFTMDGEERATHAQRAEFCMS